MKPTYNKGLLIFLSIILFFLFCFLIYLVLLKREYNIVEESKNSTTSSTTTTTKPNLTTLNQTTLTDLNLNLGEDFTKTFQIKLGQNNSNLKIENTYTETTTNQTNHLSFYLNDKLCQELNQVFDKTTNTNNLEFNYLSTYKDEYLVLSYLSPLNNYNIQEEYVYFCNDRATLNLKSI